MVDRDRLLWAQAETNSHWSFVAGQTWSLTTEGKKGVSLLTSDIALPLTIDPSVHIGFVGARQFGFRVCKSWDKLAFGVAVENGDGGAGRGQAADAGLAQAGGAARDER